MLVGHPMETEDDFNELVEFVKDFKFDKLGVFTYSEEEGTTAAIKYTDSISEETKAEREQVLMDLQRDISLSLNSAKVNKVLKVIVDRIEDGKFIGRSQYDSVEVDGEVIFTATEELTIGEFYNVLITGFDEYDLFGKKI
jgi:ribosomal protein S12 methylthiotransferase